MEEKLHYLLQDSQIKTYLNKPTTDLVPGSNILFIAINMNTLSNIGRLLLQGHKNIAGLVVKTYKKKQLKSPFSNIAKLKLSIYTHCICTSAHLCGSHRIQFDGLFRGLLSDSPRLRVTSPLQPKGSSQFWQQSLNRGFIIYLSYTLFWH